MKQEVELIWITPNAEQVIVDCARVSNPANQGKEGSKLLKYLVKHKHWSPFEMASMCISIKTTRDISRQIIRHRSFSFQEFCVAEGTKISVILGSSSKKVKIEDLYKRFTSNQYWNMSENLVRVFDENSKTLVAAKIKEVFKTGIKPVYKLTLDNGRTIESTCEHKFLTKEGFKKLSEITTDMFVGCNGVPEYQTAGWLEQSKLESIENKKGLNYIADKAAVSPHTIRKWLKKHNLQFTKKQVAMYTTIWNKGLETEKQPRYDKNITEQSREKMRKASKKGADSPFYNGVTERGFAREVRDYWYKRKNLLVKSRGNICAVSGVSCEYDDLEIDHIKPLVKFPELAYEESNIQLLSKKEHRKKSAEESSRRLLTTSWHKVMSVEYVGEKETYDMEIEHSSHNYVANGIITHNSQRYAEVDSSMFYDRECRLQDQDNRQNSIATDDPDVKALFMNLQDGVRRLSLESYQKALDSGIAKEQARALLPEGMTGSHLYMSGTIRSWLHYVDVRDGNGTQKEHIEIAKMIKEIMQDQIPFIKGLL